MRILLAIPSLHLGGAETQFVHLANGLHQRGHQVIVAAFSSGGPLESALRGPKLHTLAKTSRLDNLAVFRRLAGLAREFRPDVYYGFLTLPNLMGALLRLTRPGLGLAFGLRASDMDLKRYGAAASLSTALERQASRLAGLAICNSEAGRAHAQRQGYRPGLLRVVPNGIDTKRCRPDRALGLPLRQEWGAGEGRLLIGLVARLDPMKDHPTFLEAAARLATTLPEVRFVCVGGGPRNYEAELRERAEALGLAGRIIWAGPQTDMPAVYNALDLLCLSSTFGEGFPNVLGEAMACGVPCITTAVGDAVLVVGETGEVAPRGDAPALAQAMLRQLGRLEREGDGLRATCRERVETKFTLDRMVGKTEALLKSLCGAPRTPQP